VSRSRARRRWRVSGRVRLPRGWAEQRVTWGWPGAPARSYHRAVVIGQGRDTCGTGGRGGAPREPSRAAVVERISHGKVVPAYMEEDIRSAMGRAGTAPARPSHAAVTLML
jgi:hypothetical protein